MFYCRSEMEKYEASDVPRHILAEDILVSWAFLMQHHLWMIYVLKYDFEVLFRNELEGSFWAHVKAFSVLCPNTMRSHFLFLQLKAWFV